MLLIETNSISNMGCQKIKIVQSLSYSGYLTNTSCVCQVAGISKSSNDKQKSFFLKNIGMLVFETLKNKKSDFLNSIVPFFEFLFYIFILFLTVLKVWRPERKFPVSK